MRDCSMNFLSFSKSWGCWKRLVALDGSKVPTPASYQGCGKVKQTRKVKVKGQKEPVTQEYYVYGWKVLVLIEVQTRLPLAMKLVPIQDYEGKWLIPLLEQAQQNLGTHAHIATIVVDREYLDGEDLWRVHQKGVIFVICGKATMAVTHISTGKQVCKKQMHFEGTMQAASHLSAGIFSLQATFFAAQGSLVLKNCFFLSGGEGQLRYALI